MLPAQASYTDPLKVTLAANYPYRSEGIIRALSTDSGSPAALQIEGITNNSYVLYDFVRFRENNITIPFHIRAMPIAGGTVEISAGDFAVENYPLGECEIKGQAGVWSDFSVDLEFGEWFLMWNGDNTRQDLKLVFKGEDGKELFAISEFYMGDSKPEYADTVDRIVKTGIASDITNNSAIVTGNEFMYFDANEIVEAGVVYSWAHDFHLYLDNPDVTSFVRTDDPGSPFTVTLEGLVQAPGIPFIKYRAYAKTENGIYLGNAKQFKQ